MSRADKSTTIINNKHITFKNIETCYRKSRKEIDRMIKEGKYYIAGDGVLCIMLGR